MNLGAYVLVICMGLYGGECNMFYRIEYATAQDCFNDLAWFADRLGVPMYCRPKYLRLT